MMMPLEKRSDPFWAFARQMLRARAQVATSLLMVSLTSGSLGVGLLGAKPVMEAILGKKRQGIDALAVQANEWLTENVSKTVQIPATWIAHLPTDPFTSLAWIMGALCGLAVVGAICNFAHAYIAQSVVNTTATRIRHEAFRALVRGSMKDLWLMGGSDAVSRVVNDSSALANGLNVLLSKAVLQIFKGVAALAVAFVFDWRVTVGALVVAPAMYTVIRKLGKRIKRGSKAALSSQAGLYATAAEVAGALRMVKVSTNESHEIARFHRENKAMLRELNHIRTARALASPITEMLSIFMLCGLVLLAGNAILTHGLDPGNIILALGSLAVAGASLKPITGIINEIQAASPAAGRLQELINRSIERDSGGVRLAKHRESIEFDRVSFTYPSTAGVNGNADVNALVTKEITTRSAAIRDVTLRVPHGKRYAIVGPNGSGKTTLLSLLPRLFEPDTGCVRIDGVDIRTVSLRSLRRQIGVVSQDVVLLRGTMRENIAYGVIATDAEVEAAARKARCHDFIAAMPEVYATRVGEGGLGLSGGQRQRVAIARAILRDPAILILDEATSMIDPESEGAITAALAEFGAGRTCLIVAHRLGTVRSCDAIVVMDDGVVVDVGTHEVLMSRCALYQALARDQFAGT